jgi:hypothetical protein
MPSIQWWLPRLATFHVGDGGGKVDQPDIIEFRTAHTFGLQNAEQARLMQILLGLDRQAAQLLCLCRTGFQGGHQRAGTLQHGLVIMDITAGRAGFGSTIEMNDSIGHRHFLVDLVGSQSGD